MRALISIIFGGFVVIVITSGGAYWTGRHIGPVKPLPLADDFLVADVFVHDTLYGQDPLMNVERTVMKSFRGNWTVEVNTNEGIYVCSSSGGSIYTPDSITPTEITLFDWWMLAGDDPESSCLPAFYPLPVDCYYVDTVWEATDFEGNFIAIFNRSNEFCVIEE